MSFGRSATNAVRSLLQSRISSATPKAQYYSQRPTNLLQFQNPSSTLAATTSTSWLTPSFRPMSSSSSTTSKGQRSRPNPKLRVHAVSIPHGDYDYHEDDDYHYGDDLPFPNEDDVDEGWDIVKTNDNDKPPPPPRGTSNLDKEAAAALAHQQNADERKARWIENAKPPVRVREIDERGRSYGRGGRKTTTARVWIQPGEGVITVNRRDILDYFPRESHREMIISPFIASKTCGLFDVTVAVEGGGVSGKAGAIRHGIARALEKYNPDYRPPMKRLGYMTRDPRKVERKKVGLKKARKAPQWVRR